MAARYGHYRRHFYLFIVVEVAVIGIAFIIIVVVVLLYLFLFFFKAVNAPNELAYNITHSCSILVICTLRNKYVHVRATGIFLTFSLFSYVNLKTL